MKTSNVLASVLFSTVALAAPLDRRAYATKTEVKMEYYTVYTTVTGAQPATASIPGQFYEQPKTSAQQQTTVATSSSSLSSSSSSSSSATPTVIAPEPTSSSYSVVVPSSTEQKPEPTTTSVYTPPPAPSTTQVLPPPQPTSTYVAPPPPSTTPVAPAPQPSTPSGGGDGSVVTGGSYTLYYPGGGYGACGDPISDDSMSVALDDEKFGDTMHDQMTGKTLNSACGKKVEITNNGNTAIAYVRDRCPGCEKGGLDATPALWKATTGGAGGAVGDRLWTMSYRFID